MFLIQRDIFPWDLAILLLLALSMSTAIAAVCWFRRKGRKHFVAGLLVGFLGFFGFLGFLTVVYGSFIEPHLLTVTRHTVDFPSSQKLRITVISDLHLGPYKGEAFAKRVVRAVNRTLPDVVLIAGDLLFTEEADPQQLYGLRGIRAPLGTFAIIGNHDLGYSNVTGQRQSRADIVHAMLESMGMTVLRNESTVLHMPTGDLAIVGVDDPLWQEYSLEEAMREVPAGVPTILLSHSPDVILHPRSSAAQLIVAGHTHGGQIRLPFIGPVAMIPDRVGNDFDQGLFANDDDTTLAITRGVGESGPRARLFAVPEIMVLETER